MNASGFATGPRVHYTARMKALSIGLVVPFGEPSEGFFPDALLALLGARARARGHRSALVRAYYDGRDPDADRRVAARLEAWLDEHDVDLVVLERLFDPAPVLAHLAKKPGRVAALVSRGDSFDPVEGVTYVVGGNPGRTRSGATRRTPAIAELELAFERFTDALATGADPAQVPGVAQVVDGELVLARPLEKPAATATFDALVDHDTICEGTPPAVTRKTLFGNVGCPFANDPLKTPHFQTISLPAQIPVAKLGCAFCAMGGDYEKRPDAVVVQELVEQAAFWAARVPTLREFVLNDQHALRYLAELVRAASKAGVPPMTWLFAARADSFVRERSRVEDAIRAALEAGQRIEVYLTGFEAFSDVELARYNKGVTVADELASVAAMRELARAHPTAFGYASARGHSLILWNPWTRPEELLESVENVRRAGLSELFHELGKNRLRLYRDLPIFYAAERDGALTNAWDDGDEGAGRRKGYSVEHPWRFLDPRTRVAYELSHRLRERLGGESEVSQLAAAARYAASGATGVDAVLADLDSLRTALRLASGRSRGSQAATVELAQACNNGCPGCPHRDHWLDDDADALRSRLERALENRLPIMFVGREPTLHPALPSLVAQARKSGPVGIVSNGRRFASEAYANHLARAGLSCASIKLFGVDASSADAYTRAPGGFDQTLAGFENLRRANLFTELRLVLHAGWLDRAAEFEPLLARLPVTQVRIEAPIDAVGLDALQAAARAVGTISEVCARLNLGLDASPLETGQRLLDWMPGALAPAQSSSKVRQPNPTTSAT